MDFRHLEYLQEKYLGPERYLNKMEVVENQQLDEIKKPLPVGKMDAKAKKLSSKFLKSKPGSPEAGKLISRVSQITGTRDRKVVSDSYDIYDLILSHLLDEGYAETPEAAEAIMVSMSEDWRESIVDEFVELNEGVRSTLKKIFGKNKKTKEDQPESRGAYLRRKYNAGPDRSGTSAKRQILDRSRARAEKDEEEYGDSTYSKSVAQKSREAHNRYLKAGYSKYGATHTAGSAPEQGRGSKARRRAENR